MNLLFYFYEYGCGLWASSGPFPLLARQGLYKRGRDPPTNPSRHLKKERVSLHLKWLLKEGQGGEPTAATAAATAAAPVVPPPCPPPRPPPSPALPTVHLRAAFQPPPPLPPPQAAVATATARSLHHHLPSSSTDHPLHLPLHLHLHLRRISQPPLPIISLPTPPFILHGPSSPISSSTIISGEPPNRRPHSSSFPRFPLPSTSRIPPPSRFPSAAFASRCRRRHAPPQTPPPPRSPPATSSATFRAAVRSPPDSPQSSEPAPSRGLPPLPSSSDPPPGEPSFTPGSSPRPPSPRAATTVTGETLGRSGRFPLSRLSGNRPHSTRTGRVNPNRPGSALTRTDRAGRSQLDWPGPSPRPSPVPAGPDLLGRPAKPEPVRAPRTGPPRSRPAQDNPDWSRPAQTVLNRPRPPRTGLGRRHPPSDIAPLATTRHRPAPRRTLLRAPSLTRPGAPHRCRARRPPSPRPTGLAPRRLGIHSPLSYFEVLYFL